MRKLMLTLTLLTLSSCAKVDGRAPVKPNQEVHGSAETLDQRTRQTTNQVWPWVAALLGSQFLFGVLGPILANRSQTKDLKREIKNGHGK